jgi:hypothetical protein
MAAPRTALRNAQRLALAAVVAASACDSPLSERMIDLDATGAAQVTLFLDNNLNAQFDPAVDDVLTDRAVVVRRVGVADSTLAETDDTGVARVDELGVGRYVATVGAAVRGDSLVSALDTIEFQVLPLDTARVQLGVQYPEVDVEAFRALPLGRRAWIHVVVLNTPATFGDSTMHVADTTAAIRAINIRINLPVSPGDSIDLLGTRRARAGQPATEPLLALPRGGDVNPPPLDVTTADAATADGGELDAAFVAVRRVEVLDTTTTFTERLMTVDDGSGPLVVSMHFGINPQNIFVPGVELDVFGLLVPDPSTTSWVLRPRMRADFAIHSSPASSP